MTSNEKLNERSSYPVSFIAFENMNNQKQQN